MIWIIPVLNTIPPQGASEFHRSGCFSHCDDIPVSQPSVLVVAVFPAIVANFHQRPLAFSASSLLFPAFSENWGKFTLSPRQN